MDEQKTTTEEKSENTTSNANEGNKSETTTLFEKTNEATKRLEDANRKTEELLTRQEEVYAREKLGGTSEAGVEAVAPKEDTPEEYAEKLMAGTVNPFEKYAN